MGEVTAQEAEGTKPPVDVVLTCTGASRSLGSQRTPSVERLPVRLGA
jgi:hypothetical protein